MRTADIKIGGEYALTDVGGVAKIRVTEKGCPSPNSWEKTKDGVRFEIVESEGFVSGRTVVKSRYIEQWSERHDHLLVRIRAQKAFEERIERIADRLDMPVFSSGGRVSMRPDDFFELLKRCGVETN